MHKLGYSLLLIAAAGATAHSAPAQAAEMTAGDLQQLCSSQKLDLDSACRFYIMGIVQGITIGMGMADGQVGGKPCIPDDLPMTKLETVVKAQLGADLMVNPQDKELPASSLVGAAIATTFKCQKVR